MSILPSPVGSGYLKLWPLALIFLFYLFPHSTGTITQLTACLPSMLEPLGKIPGTAQARHSDTHLETSNQYAGANRRCKGNLKSFSKKPICTRVDLRDLGHCPFKIRLKYNVLIFRINPTKAIINMLGKEIYKGRGNYL